MKLIIDIDEQTYNKARIYITELEIKDILIVRKAIRKGVKLETELEEIKAVIQHEKSKHLGEGKYTYTAGLKTAIDLIDKHIKGVDNEIL